MRAITSKTAPAELTPREQAFIEQVTEEHIRFNRPLDLLSVRDVADITKTPKETIQEWIERGAIRAWDVCGSPRRRRVSLGEVRAAALGIRQAHQGLVLKSEVQACSDFVNPAELSLGDPTEFVRETNAFEAARALQSFRKRKTGGRNGGRRSRCRVCDGAGYTVELGEPVNGIREVLRPTCTKCKGVGWIPARQQKHLRNVKESARQEVGPRPVACAAISTSQAVN